MNLLRYLLLALVVVASAVAADMDPLYHLYGSKRSYETVAAPDSVIGSTLRFEASPIIVPQRGEIEEESLGDHYFISTEPLVLAKPDAETLSRLLTATSSFTWNEEEKECFPEYNIRLVFKKADVEVTLELCLGCEILRVLIPGGEETREDFDPISSPLFSLCRKLFPRDRVLREIQKVREFRKAAQEERAGKK